MPFPEFEIPDDAARAGFVLKSSGALISKTIMVPDLATLLLRPERDFQVQILEENVLHKATQGNRKDIYSRLRRFYALDRAIPIFHVLSALWNNAEEQRPVMALLLAAARDPLLRATAPIVLETDHGASLLAHPLAEAVARAFPGKYSPASLGSMSRNALSSWTQSGHLSSKKIRQSPQVGPEAAAYALYLGHLCGARGLGLFTTAWAALLEISPERWDELAFVASQRGWLHYRRIGSVVEIDFPWKEREYS